MYSVVPGGSDTSVAAGGGAGFCGAAARATTAGASVRALARNQIRVLMDTIPPRRRERVIGPNEIPWLYQ